ncbi:DUF6174 domain-containing protein [Streptomyces sp. NPDC052610]|uniref:DUF6174 domain-containing protein n=1 Tax=Streptomyces sp. NPDC052610 TaxID=3154952 RepID=UPI003445E9CD
MTAVRRTARSVTAALLLTGGLLATTAACGDDTPTPRATAAEEQGTDWKEPAAYSYTLTSSEGERSLLGTFRVTVRDGEVTDAKGLDESGRRVVEQLPGEVPTLGELLEELARARRDDADTAEAKYAADGHPVRISLDWDENALDDEADYVVTGYEPGPGTD